MTDHERFIRDRMMEDAARVDAEAQVFLRMGYETHELMAIQQRRGGMLGPPHIVPKSAMQPALDEWARRGKPTC